SSDVVLAQKALFDQAWTHALSPAELAADALPGQVQVLRGHWVRGARLQEMVAGAKQSILLEASATEASGWAQQGILSALAQRAGQGVRVVLRLAAGAAVAVPGAIVEPPRGQPRGLVAVVDGVQTLVALGLARPGQAGNPEDEWCLWSTHPDFVALLGSDWSRPGEALVRQGRTNTA
ncbi:MAG TPA: hypothetical protein VM327_02445, partial [Candidatus Thermoplasmatota archaeon]|nr:hypothetical protein [Candidatus Thermoplasmatota archaeon]